MALPKFQKSCKYIHNLRLHSPLSHMYIRNNTISQTGLKYTKVISSKERKQIKKMIKESLNEISQFLNN